MYYRVLSVYLCAVCDNQGPLRVEIMWVEPTLTWNHIETMSFDTTSSCWDYLKLDLKLLSKWWGLCTKYKHGTNSCHVCTNIHAQTIMWCDLGKPWYKIPNLSYWYHMKVWIIILFSELFTWAFCDTGIKSYWCSKAVKNTEKHENYAVNFLYFAVSFCAACDRFSQVTSHTCMHHACINYLQNKNIHAGFYLSSKCKWKSMLKYFTEENKYLNIPCFY